MNVKIKILTIKNFKVIMKHSQFSIAQESPAFRKVLPLLLFLLPFSSKAQSVIGSFGGEGNVGNMQINYTAGEAFVTTIEKDGSAITQGFHQPNLVVTAVEETFLPGRVMIFPNPTAAILNIQFADIKLENILVSLFDLAGKNLLTSSVDANTWQTNLSKLPGGYYLLTVTDLENHQINSFKLLKSN